MSCEKRRIFKCRRIIDTSTTNEQFSDDQISNLSANFCIYQTHSLVWLSQFELQFHVLKTKG